MNRLAAMGVLPQPAIQNYVLIELSKKYLLPGSLPFLLDSFYYSDSHFKVGHSKPINGIPQSQHILGFNSTGGLSDVQARFFLKVVTQRAIKRTYFVTDMCTDGFFIYVYQDEISKLFSQMGWYVYEGFKQLKGGSIC